MLYALLYSEIKEAVPIEPKQPRHISTDGVKSTAGATGQPVPNKKKPKRKRHPVAAFFRFIGCLLCVCVMAASVGGVLLSMYIVQVTANDGDVLDLDNQKNKQTTIVYDKNSDEYATLTKGENRIWRELSAMPENLQHAVIAIEDKDFYNEPGINIKRTIGAALNEFTDHALYGSQQGASTLEQQLIKNLTGDNETDKMRKVREIFRALGLSNKYSKETVLEAYLNTIPLTGIVCGMEAGANEYFGKHVEDLTLSECAILASITKNPTKYNPFTNPEQLVKRRNHVLYEMYNQGYITEDEYNSATAETIKVVESKGGAENVTRTSNNSYFTDALFNEVVQDIMTKEGISESEAQKLLYTGGFTIEATVNTKLQSKMENLMLNTDDAYFPAGWHEEEVTSISDDDVQVFNEDGTPKTRTGEDGTVYYYRNVRTQAAMVTLDYDGNVLAIAGGLGEKTKSLSLNRAYNVERQTGSTIKPIGAYALGIEYGLVNWSTMLNNSPLYQKQDMIIRDEDYCRKNGLMGLSDKQLRAYPNAWRSWPRNYGGNYGDGSDLPLWNGLARSLNTIAVRVGDLVGASNIFNFVYNTLQLNTLDPTNDVGLAQMVMGSQTKGVTPMALAAAFQTDAVQLAVAAGFDIQRHPFQRRTIVRVRLHARVDQLRAARFAFHPHRGGDKALHQIALRRADIAFVNGDAAVAEHLLQTHQLAMGAAVEANNRLTVEIFQGQRGEAEPFLPLQQPFSLRPLRFGNKGDGLLRREGDLQRTVVGGQPEGELGALRSVPPVTGE